MSKVLNTSLFAKQLVFVSKNGKTLDSLKPLGEQSDMLDFRSNPIEIEIRIHHFGAWIENKEGNELKRSFHFDYRDNFYWRFLLRRKHCFRSDVEKKTKESQNITFKNKKDKISCEKRNGLPINYCIFSNIFYSGKANLISTITYTFQHLVFKVISKQKAHSLVKQNIFMDNLLPKQRKKLLASNFGSQRARAK